MIRVSVTEDVDFMCSGCRGIHRATCSPDAIAQMDENDGVITATCPATGEQAAMRWMRIPGVLIGAF